MKLNSPQTFPVTQAKYLQDAFIKLKLNSDQPLALFAFLGKSFMGLKKIRFLLLTSVK
jgi:hypothetical protein